MNQGAFKKVLSGVVIGGLAMTLGLGCKKKEKVEEPPFGTEESAPTNPEEVPSGAADPYGTEVPTDSYGTEVPTDSSEEPGQPDETTQAPMP